jgi:hypothetical protein
VIAGERHVRLLVTLVLGSSEHEVALDRVSVVDDEDAFPDVPMLSRVIDAGERLDGLSDWQQFRARKRLAQCLLMDEHQVPNGDKSIDRAMHRHWTPALAAIFGEPDSPSSVRRWRQQRGTPGRRRLQDMLSRSASARRGPA